jgi:hypothetical protein
VLRATSRPATLRRDATTFTLLTKAASLPRGIVSAALHSWLNDPTLEASDDTEGVRAPCNR